MVIHMYISAIIFLHSQDKFIGGSRKVDHEVIFNSHKELGTGGWADIPADEGT